MLLLSAALLLPRAPVRAPPCALLAAGPSSSSSDAASFARGTDLLQTADKVSARKIVNVLGRWGSHTDWNSAGIGRKGKLDDLRKGDYYDDDVPSLATDFTQPQEFYIARRVSCLPASNPFF